MGAKPARIRGGSCRKFRFTADSLPDEILKIVLSYLRPNDAISLGLTSKSWKKIITDALLKSLFGVTHEEMRTSAILLPVQYSSFSVKKSQTDDEAVEGYVKQCKKSNASLKIMVGGAASAGRSAFTLRLAIRQFVEEYDPTIEDSFNIHFPLPGSRNIVNIELLDTAIESQCYSAMGDLYQKYTEGLFVLFAVNQRGQFEESQHIIAQFIRVRQFGDVCNFLPPIMLIATKMDIDLPGEEKLEMVNRARSFARKVGIGFSTVSAKNDCNLTECLAAMVKMVLKLKYEEGFKEKMHLDLQQNFQTNLRNSVDQLKCGYY